MISETYFAEDENDDDESVCIECGRPISPHDLACGKWFCAICEEVEREYREQLAEMMADCEQPLEL